MKFLVTNMRVIHIVWLTMLIIAFLTFGCTNPYTDAPASGSVHTKSWNNPDSIGSIDFHGTKANQDGSESCQLCHGKDLNGSGDIQGCFDCHFGPNGSQTPSGSGWEHGNNDSHQDFEDVSNVCNQCHDLNRSYGNEPAACHDCHGEGLTHVLGQDWLDKKSPQFHGNEPTDNCSDCHDLNFTCNECHFGVSASRAPIGSGWIHGDNEDHRQYENYQSVCNRCNKLNRSYQNDPDSCHDCHDD